MALIDLHPNLWKWSRDCILRARRLDRGWVEIPGLWFPGHRYEYDAPLGNGDKLEMGCSYLYGSLGSNPVSLTCFSTFLLG